MARISRTRRHAAVRLEDLFVIDAYDSELIGSRIDFFGETTAAAAYEIVANAFPGDDMEARWMGVRHLTQAYMLEALGIIENGTTATLTVTDRPASNAT